MSECRRTLDQLVAYADGLLPQAERAGVERHLDACPPCRRAADGVAGGRVVLREGGARVAHALPPGLRTRCEALTRDAQPARTSLWGRRLAAAAAVIVIVVSTVGVLFAMATERSNVLLAQQLIVDHMKCFFFEGSSEPVAAPDRPFGRVLHLPPSSSAAGVTLVGVRRCLYASGVTPHAMYRVGGANLSLYVLDGVSRATADVVTFGYRARIWSQGGRSFVLVGTSADADLSQATRYLMNEVH